MHACAAVARGRQWPPCGGVSCRVACVQRDRSCMADPPPPTHTHHTHTHTCTHPPPAHTRSFAHPTIAGQLLRGQRLAGRARTVGRAHGKGRGREHRRFPHRGRQLGAVGRSRHGSSRHQGVRRVCRRRRHAAAHGDGDAGAVPGALLPSWCLPRAAACSGRGPAAHLCPNPFHHPRRFWTRSTPRRSTGTPSLAAAAAAPAVRAVAYAPRPLRR